jgi:hypothetical protein
LRMPLRPSARGKPVRTASAIDVEVVMVLCFQ